MNNKFPISDEKLQKLAEWLRSDEGRKAIRESLEATDEVNKIIDRMREIDPEKLREPYMGSVPEPPPPPPPRLLKNMDIL